MKKRWRLIMVAVLLSGVHIVSARRAHDLLQREEEQHIVLWALFLCLALFIVLAIGKNWARILTVLLCSSSGLTGSAAALVSISATSPPMRLTHEDSLHLGVAALLQLIAAAYLFYSSGIKRELRKLRR
jgi:hypothetical protein